MELAALLLADGRFPAGGHAHSAGLEAAVADGRVGDVGDLSRYLLGRLHTAASTDAALSAAALLHLGARADAESALALDAEANARIAVPALRAASRRLGRQMVRAGARCWPSSTLALLLDASDASGGPHVTVALGAVGVSAGVSALDVARLSIHGALMTPAQAAVRLLGLDPYAVTAAVAALAPAAEAVARAAADAARGPLEDLPAPTGPVSEIAAAAHAVADDRLFLT